MTAATRSTAIAVRRLAAAAIALSAGPALALTYVCDVNGHHYTGDAPPPDCVNRVEIRVLNPDGSPHDLIRRPKTQEEKDREAKARRDWEDCNRKRLEQQHDDRSLLETYANESEIVAARDALIRTPKGAVERAKLELDELRKQREKLENERQFYLNHPMPLPLKRDIEATEEQLQLENTLLAQAQAQVEQIAERYAVKQRRFHDLAGGTATAIPCPPEPTASE